MTLGHANEVAYWITERENIRARKEAGAKTPWTSDPILAAYRFCNVRREHDAVTRWIARNIRAPYRNHPALPQLLTLSRMVNWPPTLARLGDLSNWDEDRIVAEIHSAERVGKAWSSAYIVSTNGKPINKALYIVRDVCGRVPSMALLAQAGGSLAALHARLMKVNGLGSFMAAQVVADLKNTPGNPFEDAHDWWTWAAPGPGSKRGLRRYFGDNGMPRNKDFLGALQIMIEEVTPLLPEEIGRLCAQDWQNVMCEFDKWKRAKHNEGRPKAYYRPNPRFPEGTNGSVSV